MDANRERAAGRPGTGGANDPSYIWLRYSTQFTTGGRTHTIEMEVPMPVGASAEQREQLIREAEADMEQLYRRVESRARGQRPPETTQRDTGSSSSTRPVQAGRPAPPAPPAPPASPMPVAPSTQTAQPAQISRRESPRPASDEASTPAAREAPQPLSLQDRRAASPSTPTPASVARPGIAAEMPVTPDLSSSASGNMKLGEFIQIIRENWGITPKQALELLQVKSLNNMNYRDLLRRLEPLVGQTNGGSATSHDAPVAPASRPAGPPSSQNQRAPTAPPPATPRRETGPKESPVARAASSESSLLVGPANIPVYPLREHTVRETGRAYKFDEEEEEDDLESASGASQPEQVDEDQNSMSSALARIKIDDLRTMQGTTVANPGRVVVLHNVLGDQISDAQFQRLIEQLWRVSSDKKLKQDQVEALISWAKEDYFEDEARAVLAVLNEE